MTDEELEQWAGHPLLAEVERLRNDLRASRAEVERLREVEEAAIVMSGDAARWMRLFEEANIQLVRDEAEVRRLRTPLWPTDPAPTG